MTILTWDEYKRQVGDVISARFQVLCRGHNNDAWTLTTSFHRAARSNGLTLPEYVDTILPEIHYHICATRGEAINLKNTEEFAAFLALLQHHGFPTPLLDWTISPYIAAYFAFRDVEEPHPFTDHVKIYIFKYGEWLRTFEQPLDLRDMSTNYVSVVRPYARYTPRIVAQQGMFTVTNVDDMQVFIKTIEKEHKKQFLYEISISSKEKPRVMRDLNSMGINDMTLFPGIDGICRALRRSFFSADKIELTFSELMQRAITASVPSNAPDCDTVEPEISPEKS